jgi:hypothetical protein
MLAMEFVAGEAEPIASGAIAKPKMMPPIQTVLTQVLFRSKQRKIIS